MKFMQEMRGYNLVTNRYPAPKVNGMYLTQLRSHIAETTLPPRRKLAISITPGDASNQLRVVRIVRVGGR